MSEIRPFIVCENLVKIYKLAELEVVALQGLDAEVEPGEFLGIVGTASPRSCRFSAASTDRRPARSLSQVRISLR